MTVYDDMIPSGRQASGPEAERWLMRLQSPDCSAAERTRFEDWRQADPANARAFAAAEYYWRRAAELEQDPDLLAIADAALERQRRGRTFRANWSDRMPTLAAAAMIAVVAIGLATYGYRSDWFGPEPQRYATAVGERRSVTLKDGSALMLNTDTTVEVRYRRGTRLIVLVRGEAQFDVQPDTRRPFTVTAGDTAVTALGTRFQVSAGDESTIVTLLEGRVRVTDAANDAGAGRSAELHSGERLLARRDGTVWQRDTIDPAIIAAGWTEGRLVFRALPLAQAVEEMNRYTAGKVRLADKSLDDIRVNGVFDAGDTDSVLAALQYAYPIQVERPSPDETVLRRRQ